MSQVWKHIYPGLNHLMFCIVHFPILSRFGRSCIYEGTNKSMLLNAQSPFVCICLLLHTKTVFSLPGVPLTNPSLSLIQKPAASNLSKPTYPSRYTQIQVRTNIPPTSSDTFAIPNTDLVLNFSVFGSVLEISQLDDLLTRAQDDIQTLINRYGADARTRDEAYDPWRTGDLALEIYRVTMPVRLTLGQFRSLIEGLWLYMIQNRRSREAIFRLLRESEHSLTTLAGGDLWLIYDDVRSGCENSVTVGDTDQQLGPAVTTPPPSRGPALHPQRKSWCDGQPFASCIQSTYPNAKYP